ncbi:MAG: hypothetical protein ABIG28_03505 [archaeon]
MITKKFLADLEEKYKAPGLFNSVKDSMAHAVHNLNERHLVRAAEQVGEAYQCLGGIVGDGPRQDAQLIAPEDVREISGRIWEIYSWVHEETAKKRKQAELAREAKVQAPELLETVA